MAWSEITRWINRPPALVFADLTDFASYPARCHVVYLVCPPECPLRPGGVAILRLPYLELHMQILICRLPHTLALQVREGQRIVAVDLQCASVAGSAQVTHRSTWDDPQKTGVARAGRIPHSAKVFDVVLAHLWASAL